MSDVNIETLVCHGLGGNYKNDYKFDYASLLDTFKSDIREKMRGEITAEYFISLYRLNQILEHKEIYTYTDIKDKELPLYNEGEKMGTYNGENSICFAQKGKSFEFPEGVTMSCDYGGGYGNYIEKDISIMLQNDKSFKELPRSKQFEGIMPDEIRIEGSIKDPNIASIGVPLIHELKWYRKEGERINKLQQYKNIVGLIRKMLDTNGYNQAYIVDSVTGYDLEDPNIMRIIDEALKERESKIMWGWKRDEYQENDYYIEGDITDKYRSFCKQLPNSGFLITSDGQITYLNYPHSLEWDMPTATYIKDFIKNNNMNAVMVYASIGANPFLVLKSMDEREILDKREQILEEREDEIIKYK
ncbi:MAG: hypothetical protein HFJ17_02445 [Clostridia bacterium]|nr:hypothetical protein [Clostridia bacterium]